MFRFASVLMLVTMALTTGFADAKSCRDPKTGKFVKCATAPSKMAPKHCRDKKTGKFIKCTSF